MTDPFQEKVATFFDYFRTHHGVVLNEIQLADLYNFWANRPIEDNTVPRFDLEEDQMLDYIDFHNNHPEISHIFDEQTQVIDTPSLSLLYTETIAREEDEDILAVINAPTIKEQIRQSGKSQDYIKEAINRTKQLKIEFLSQIGTNMDRNQLETVFLMLLRDINSNIHLDLTPEQEYIKQDFEAGFLDKLEDADKSIVENQSQLKLLGNNSSSFLKGKSTMVKSKSSSKINNSKFYSGRNSNMSEKYEKNPTPRPKKPFGSKFTAFDFDDDSDDDDAPPPKPDTNPLKIKSGFRLGPNKEQIPLSPKELKHYGQVILNNIPQYNIKPVVNGNRDKQQLNLKHFKPMDEISYKLHSGPSNEKQMDELIDLILNAKKDIKFIPSGETRDSAARYAKSHGLRLGPQGEDINNDGVEDVVLYNNKGYPVVINGYKLVPSKFPIRQYYKDTFKSRADKSQIGGYKGFMRDLWGVAGDGSFDAEGNRDVQYDTDNPPDVIKYLKNAGWRVPPAPSRKMSFYQFSTRALGKLLKQIYSSSNDLSQHLGPKQWMLKAINKMSLFSLIYMSVVDDMILRNNWLGIAGALNEIQIARSINDPEVLWAFYEKLKTKNTKALQEKINNKRQELLVDILNEKNIAKIIKQTILYETQKGVPTATDNQVIDDTTFENLEKWQKLKLKDEVAQVFRKKLDQLKRNKMTQLLSYNDEIAAN